LQNLLKKYVPTAEVWAYGSRVTGQAHNGSDLDLVVRNPNDLSQTVDGYTKLIMAIQQSTLPMIVDIHLWSNVPQSFYDNIHKHYVVIQKPI
jgi:predicted nucleotidyltransferase